MRAIIRLSLRKTLSLHPILLPRGVSLSLRQALRERFITTSSHISRSSLHQYPTTPESRLQLQQTPEQPDRDTKESSRVGPDSCYSPIFIFMWQQVAVTAALQHIAGWQTERKRENDRLNEKIAELEMELEAAREGRRRSRMD